MRLIEMGKQYRLRRGQSVRILCTDAHQTMPVVGIVEWPGAGLQKPAVSVWPKDGYVVGASPTMEHPEDLVEVEAPIVTFSFIFTNAQVGASNKTAGKLIDLFMAIDSATLLVTPRPVCILRTSVQHNANSDGTPKIEVSTQDLTSDLIDWLDANVVTP